MQEEIYSSSYAAAAYLESIDFPKDKKVCCLTSHVLTAVLALELVLMPWPAALEHSVLIRAAECPALVHPLLPCSHTAVSASLHHRGLLSLENACTSNQVAVLAFWCIQHILDHVSPCTCAVD